MIHFNAPAPGTVEMPVWGLMLLLSGCVLLPNQDGMSCGALTEAAFFTGTGWMRCRIPPPLPRFRNRVVLSQPMGRQRQGRHCHGAGEGIWDDCHPNKVTLC